MLPILINLLALLAYACASCYLFLLLKHHKHLPNKGLTTVAIIGTTLHGVGLYLLMSLPQGIDLGIHNMASLVALSISILVLLSGLKKPLHTLFIFLFPLAILSIALSLWLNQPEPHFVAVNIGVSAHILLSIIAYSLLTIAALQALAWSWQNNQLKQHRLTGIVQLLPSLQTMELLMFELVWAGATLLTLGIVSGFIYIDNIFAQHLMHKTVLSLFAWLVFTGLLWGRHALGWRGNTAVKWILSGFCLLMLAYFGSKAVLELILK